jgi:hypothetical protein
VATFGFFGGVGGCVWEGGNEAHLATLTLLMLPG